MPNFSITPARITLPTVGACTWAAGSQVCTGKDGILTAKVNSIAISASIAASPVSGGVSIHRRMSKLPVARYSPMIASKSGSEPSSV